MTTRLFCFVFFFFFRPSYNFRELSLRFLFYYSHSLDWFSVIPTFRQGKWTQRCDCTASSKQVTWVRTNTCTRRSTAHTQTCQECPFHLYAERGRHHGFSRLRDCFTSLLYFTQGAKMGRRKESGADGFHRHARVFQMKSVPPLKGWTVVEGFPVFWSW